MAESAAVRDNPFVLEPDFLLRREKDKQAAATLRADNAHKPLWDRMDFSSTMARTKKLVASLEPAFKPADLKRLEAARKEQSSLAASFARDRRAERESLVDLVGKKREMLYAKMGLAHTVEEIGRLKRTLEAREGALEKAEETLEEDAVNFDVFLQSTETAAATAEKKAEVAVRAKAEKALELKRVRLLISSVAAEKAKLVETVGEYSRYAAFLDAITPPEFVEAALARQEALRRERRGEAHREAQAAWAARLAAKTAELERHFAGERAAAVRVGRAYAMPDVPPLALAAMPPRPALEDTPLPELSEAELEIPMFFEAPAQLKEVFTKLEESNLFLIQQCQDLEQALEELGAQHAATLDSMRRQNEALEETAAALQAKIGAEEAKAAALLGAAGKAAAAAAAGGEGGAAEGAGGEGEGGGAVRLLERVQPVLHKRVVEIYERCGFKASASSDVIGMLTAMEAKLERLHAKVQSLDPAYVAGKLREKERARRGRVMAARKEKEAELHEVRLAKMLERAQAPALKRPGKPVMYRSILPAKVDAVAELAAAVEEEDEAYLL